MGIVEGKVAIVTGGTRGIGFTIGSRVSEERREGGAGRLAPGDRGCGLGQAR